MREAEQTVKQPKISTNLKRMIDIDIDALIAEGKSGALVQWAKVQNLKQLAIAHNLYHEGYISLDELDGALSTVQTAMQKSSAAYKAFEPKIAEKKTLRDWILKYVKTKDVCKGINAIKKEKDRVAYRQENESDFVIYEDALRYFKQQGLTQIPTRTAVNEAIEKLIAEKNAAYNIYCADRDRFNELKTIQQNLTEALSTPQTAKRRTHEHDL